MKILSIGLFILFLCTSMLGQNSSAGTSPVETIRIKIDANELDRRMLLEKLNARGLERPEHKVKFELADQEFAYRIVFATDQETALSNRYGHSGGGTYNSSTASATVYDSNGAELFQFKRRLRATDSGSTNAVAKEIIKRIMKLRLPA